MTPRKHDGLLFETVRDAVLSVPVKVRWDGSAYRDKRAVQAAIVAALANRKQDEDNEARASAVVGTERDGQHPRRQHPQPRRSLKMKTRVVARSRPKRKAPSRSAKSAGQGATSLRDAKKLVLARWPLAYAYEWAGPSWTIYEAPPGQSEMNQTLGDGKTAALAWRDAARRIA